MANLRAAPKLRYRRHRPSQSRSVLALKCADGDVVSVEISDSELLRSSIRVHVRLLVEPSDEPARPLHGQVEVVDAKEQQEPVSWCRTVRTHQGGVLVGTPLVETEQDSAVRVQELAEVVVGRRRLLLAEERL